MQTTNVHRLEFWSDVILSIINSTVLASKEYDITGVVFSSRARHDTIQVWNGCPLNAKKIKEISTQLRYVIDKHFTKSSSEIVIQYEAHKPVVQPLHEKPSVLRGRGRGRRPSSGVAPLGSPKDTIHKKMTSSFSAPPSPSSSSQPLLMEKSHVEPEPVIEEEPVVNTTEPVAEAHVEEKESPVVDEKPVFENKVTEETTTNDEEEKIDEKTKKKNVKRRGSGALVQPRARMSVADHSKRTIWELLSLSYDRDNLVRFLLVLVFAVLLNTLVYV
jgi:hypothetical protein